MATRTHSTQHGMTLTQRRCLSCAAKLPRARRALGRPVGMPRQLQRLCQRSAAYRRESDSRGLHAQSASVPRRGGDEHAERAPQRRAAGLRRQPAALRDACRASLASSVRVILDLMFEGRAKRRVVPSVVPRPRALGERWAPTGRCETTSNSRQHPSATVCKSTSHRDACRHQACRRTPRQPLVNNAVSF